jgi:protein SCO1/2|tara:strand:- start:8452 stop:9072 length:621 start_codon:yes stop_codon:yes gene_type:complete
MSRKKFAGLSAATLLTLVIGTFLYTQIMAPANRFEACVSGGVAGGSIGGPFELVNQKGQTVTDLEVLDQPALVYFGYTFCPDICPMDVGRNSVAVDILGDNGFKVKPVFITIDPTRDTIEYLADFAANNHPDLVGLTGTAEQIAKAARAYKVYYQKQPGDDDEYYLMNHSNFTYLMLPEFGFVDFLRSDLSPQKVADRVACVIKAA